jgi:membrane protease YdiL (CAAX protease family)
MNNTSSIKSPLQFLLLVFSISIPFWVVGAFTEQIADMLPINLPVSALMFICPLIAALILVRKANQSNGRRELLKRAFDYERIRNKIWYVPIILLMPLVMVLSYGLTLLLRLPLPEPNISFGAIPIFFLIFFISAACEEIGWSGYITDPLEDRWGALRAAILLGAVWAIWHIIPWLQTHNTPQWVVWQCAATIAMRILIVWLYNNTGKSVFAAILFHAMINVSTFVYPNYGSGYDPFLVFIILAAAVVMVTFLWGSKTLAQYRYAGSSK